MSYSVTVLLENGRRQRVAVKVNTPILVILEEVCKKNKLTAEDYDVKYHNRLLDVSSTIQFCGVANNAQLELIPATKSRVESPVTVFVQLESGKRLSGSFSPTNSLEDVIAKLCGEETLKQNPVIIYTRQEVLGDKLRTTTLKQLGLTGGNALLRLIHRTEDQLRNQLFSCVYKIPPKPKTEDPERRRKKEGTLKDFAEETSHSQSPINHEEKNLDNEIPSPVSSSKSSEPMDSDVPSTSSIISDRQPSGSGTTKPESSRTRQIVPDREDDALFNINDVKYLGERYALIFRTDEIRSPRFDDTTDDFFELTVEDAKTLLRDIKRTRSELEEAQLETAELKERRRSMMLERTISIYPHCVVRILFPNRIALQGIFKSTETVKEVVDFVSRFVTVLILEFYLYTSPPKTIVKTTQSLLELGAIPGINFYFGGPYVEANPTGPFLRSEFFDKTVTPSVALRVANHFRRAGGIRTPRPPTPKSPFSAPQLEDDDRDLHVAPPPRPSLRQSPPKNIGGGKLPKWFKPQ